MSDPMMKDLPKALLTHYQWVYETSMKALPMSNHRLSVDLFGWQDRGEVGHLGVLITPWFISLLVQPQAGLLGDSAKVGQVVTLTFPSGQYEFLINHQPSLGYYLTCALVSETRPIESQEVALLLAQQMLAYLFEPMQAVKPKPAARSNLEQKIQQAEDQLDKPVSRRALFGLRDAPAPHQQG